MKNFITFYFVIAMVFAACSTSKNNKEPAIQAYKPDDERLYQTILHLDSLYFNAYNTCDLTTQANLFSDSIEFYHDKGGLTTSKTELMESLKKYICGKVTRELVKGSIEVYPIKGYGAVEMGLHKFHNNTEKETTPSHAGKFVILWQHLNDKWKIQRVISLH